ncbi:putative ArclD1 anti-CRISPR protein [Sulfolobales Beppu filamentous virus 3]|uniref:Putative ArclD1 anti-CRISPR protein n=1 Tax=Sulfolobales Beppu filamentous virus 3 TaxID=2493124 RepID=A0A3Q8Q783_9VIRU|nr:putative ArclD1 anti-CRISPR protein [Sulfolobales Beppu filamentous virus 3]AZI75889.1 putative ArclD1 anti-CRISPR protein [Sulfolobales Beppu filamentous virus 3]
MQKVKQKLDYIKDVFLAFFNISEIKSVSVKFEELEMNEEEWGKFISLVKENEMVLINNSINIVNDFQYHKEENIVEEYEGIYNNAIKIVVKYRKVEEHSEKWYFLEELRLEEDVQY